MPLLDQSHFASCKKMFVFFVCVCVMVVNFVGENDKVKSENDSKHPVKISASMLTLLIKLGKTRQLGFHKTQ